MKNYLNRCCVCRKKISKAGHCADCRKVQDSIRFIHDKYPGVRDPREDVREQLILEHQARISAHLEPAGDSADVMV